MIYIMSIFLWNVVPNMDTVDTDSLNVSKSDPAKFLCDAWTWAKQFPALVVYWNYAYLLHNIWTRDYHET